MSSSTTAVADENEDTSTRRRPSQSTALIGRQLLWYKYNITKETVSNNIVNDNNNNNNNGIVEQMIISTSITNNNYINTTSNGNYYWTYNTITTPIGLRVFVTLYVIVAIGYVIPWLFLRSSLKVQRQHEATTATSELNSNVNKQSDAKIAQEQGQIISSYQDNDNQITIPIPIPTTDAATNTNTNTNTNSAIDYIGNGNSNTNTNTNTNNDTNNPTDTSVETMESSVQMTASTSISITTPTDTQQQHFHRYSHPEDTVMPHTNQIVLQQQQPPQQQQQQQLPLGASTIQLTTIPSSILNYNDSLTLSKTTDAASGHGPIPTDNGAIVYNRQFLPVTTNNQGLNCMSPLHMFSHFSSPLINTDTTYHPQIEHHSLPPNYLFTMTQPQPTTWFQQQQQQQQQQQHHSLPNKYPFATCNASSFQPTGIITTERALSCGDLPDDNRNQPIVITNTCTTVHSADSTATAKGTNTYTTGTNHTSNPMSNSTTTTTTTASASLTLSSQPSSNVLSKTIELLSTGNNKSRSRDDMLNRSVEHERLYVQQLILGKNDQADSASGTTNNQNVANPIIRSSNCSDIAGHAIYEPTNGQVIAGTCSETEYYRKKFTNQYKDLQGIVLVRSTTQQQMSQSRQGSNIGTNDNMSVAESQFSELPLSVSTIAPSDAATCCAPDGLYKRYLEQLEQDRIQQKLFDEKYKAQPTWFITLLELIEIDHESKRILKLALSPTMSAVANPLFRLLLLGLIAQLVDGDSMVAYLLVTLLLRLSIEEISIIITGAQSNMLHDALLMGGQQSSYQAGRYIQLAISMQVLASIPVVLLWAFRMDNVIRWFVQEGDAAVISSIATRYTSIIIVDYIVQAISKSFLLLFHITGQALFEGSIDFIATVLIAFAITVAASTADGARIQLDTIAWIQLVIGFIKTLVKFGYVLYKGWIHPLKTGLMERKLCIRDRSAVTCFFVHLLPQILGSVVEIREWDFLALFVRYLGGAEVIAWCITGAIRDVFIAFADGLGEASLVRIAFYLEEGLYDDARQLSHKVLCMVCVFVLLMTSIFLMISPTLAEIITDDTVILYLIFILVGMAGIANVAVTASQMYWSLVGAQGRIKFASLAIFSCRWFIIFPSSALVVYVSKFDPVAVAAMVAIGYSSATGILSYTFFNSDWKKLGTVRSFRQQQHQILHHHQPDQQASDGVYMDNPNVIAGTSESYNANNRDISPPGVVVEDLLNNNIEESPTGYYDDDDDDDESYDESTYYESTVASERVFL